MYLMIVNYKQLFSILNKNFFLFLDKETISFRLAYWKFFFFFFFFNKIYFLFMQHMFLNNINYFIFYLKIYRVILKNKFKLILKKKLNLDYSYELIFKKNLAFNFILKANYYLVV
uniref:Uncharacterized protein n=1 Tax=Gruberia lanceolata TaxID=1978530 RepID=A0A6C0UCI3_9CILI|nr:hypothetical protein [Gruberia lanceolata]